MDRFYYWRTRLGGFGENRYLSKIYFDGLDDLNNLRDQCSHEKAMVFSGIYPHVGKLQMASMTQSIATFKDFYSIVIFPYLHHPRIKVKISGRKSDDKHILATKLFLGKVIVLLDTSN